MVVSIMSLIFILTRYCEMCGSTTTFSSNNSGPGAGERQLLSEIAIMQVHLPSGWKLLRLNDEACVIQIDVRQVAKCFVRNRR